ncbi:MAG: hypothetical protein ACLT3Y_03400 [Ruminococcus callidus]
MAIVGTTESVAAQGTAQLMAGTNTLSPVVYHTSSGCTCRGTASP